MTARYKIVGTIHVDAPQGTQPAQADDLALEQYLLGIAVCDALGEGQRACRDRRGFPSSAVGHRQACIRADVEALIAELQSEWARLEAARP